MTLIACEPIGIPNTMLRGVPNEIFCFTFLKKEDYILYKKNYVKLWS